jgi:16S rRNA (guanine966-N2)-methyltransferase
MRIVAGSARGRTLAAPRGRGTRPTSDKVRGAVFNVLGQFFEGGAVLDLYAGSGALALEALARGVDRASCVESDRGAAVIRRNAESCGFSQRVEIRREAVEAVLRRAPGDPFALAFLDPPYDMGPELALSCLGAWLAPGALAVAEHHAHRPPLERYGALVLAERRQYGDTGISIYRLD